MSLADQLQADLTAAMKSRDAATTATLRLVLAAVKTVRTERGAGGQVSDEQVLTLLAREAKKRTEAADSYAGAGREDLAAKERDELGIIQRYLPDPLPAEEVTALIEVAIAETGAAAPSDLGKVMAVLIPRLQGRADGKAVSTQVRDRLVN